MRMKPRQLSTITQVMTSMPVTTTPPQRITFPARYSKSDQSTRHLVWWGPVWRGLFVDPAGKHYRAMGRALWLYGYLIVHADRRTGILYRKVRTISGDMQVSGRTVQEWLLVLRRHGYIRTRTTGRSLVIMIERWKPIQSIQRNTSNAGASFQPVP